MQSKAGETPKFVQKAVDQLNSIGTKSKSFFKTDEEVEINGQTYCFASLNKRLLASTLDVLLISILLLPLNFIFNNFNEKLLKFQIKPEYVLERVTFSTVIEMLSVSGLLLDLILIQIGVALVVGIYMTLFLSSRKMATPGKMLFRCVVLDEKTGGRISLKKAIIRFISMPLSLLSLMIGVLMIDWTKNRQSLHDKIVGTIVVYTKKRT